MLDNEFVRKLIESIRKNRCLFDRRDAFYFNKVKRERAWNEVSKETGKSSTECKMKWKALRKRIPHDSMKSCRTRCDGLDRLIEQFGSVIQKLENQITQPMVNSPETDGDKLYIQMILSLMRDLPVQVKEQFQTEMIARVMELRSEHRLRSN